MFVDADWIRWRDKSSNSEVEFVIKEWLRLAKDRDGGWRKRERGNRSIDKSLDSGKAIPEANSRDSLRSWVRDRVRILVTELVIAKLVTEKLDDDKERQIFSLVTDLTSLNNS